MTAHILSPPAMAITQNPPAKKGNSREPTRPQHELMVSVIHSFEIQIGEITYLYLPHSTSAMRPRPLFCQSFNDFIAIARDRYSR